MHTDPCISLRMCAFRIYNSCLTPLSRYHWGFFVRIHSEHSPSSPNIKDEVVKQYKMYMYLYLWDTREVYSPGSWESNLNTEPLTEWHSNLVIWEHLKPLKRFTIIVIIITTTTSIDARTLKRIRPDHWHLIKSVHILKWDTALQWNPKSNSQFHENLVYGVHITARIKEIICTYLL